MTPQTAEFGVLLIAFSMIGVMWAGFGIAAELAKIAAAMK